MDQNRAFVEAIREDPDDDGVRLVYADWLEEHGDPDRAELIRVQITLETLAGGAEARPALIAREQALLTEHGARWAEPLKGLVWSWRFRRGFVEAVGVEGSEPFARQLKQVIELVPLRSLTLGSQDPNARHMHAAAPFMTRLRRLQFGYPNFGGRSRRAETTFFGRPELRGLSALYIMGDRNGSGLSEEVARAVINSPSLAGLTELTLIQDCRGLTAPSIRALAASRHMARLERLSLEQSSIDADTLRVLGHSPWLGSLKELDLGGCAMPGAAWDCLLTGPVFGQLRRLYLWNARLTGEASGRTYYPEHIIVNTYRVSSVESI
jgi:uncharacterized protein (TIGR02996 family)